MNNEQENRNDAEPKYWLSTFLCIKLNGFPIYYDSTISSFYYNSNYDPYVYLFLHKIGIILKVGLFLRSNY